MVDLPVREEGQVAPEATTPDTLPYMLPYMALSFSTTAVSIGEVRAAVSADTIHCLA